MTPQQYLKPLKLLEARRLLRARDERVSDIAAQFSRDQVRAFGTVPSQHRFQGTV